MNNTGERSVVEAQAAKARRMAYESSISMEVYTHRPTGRGSESTHRMVLCFAKAFVHVDNRGM